MSSTSTDQTPSVITTIRALTQVFSSDSDSNPQTPKHAGFDHLLHETESVSDGKLCDLGIRPPGDT